MSQKIKAPNEKNQSFIWGIGALIVIAAVFIGFMVFNGRSNGALEISAEDTDLTVTQENGVIELRSDTSDEAAPVADIYEDYSCTHCADLAEVHSDSIEDAVEDGTLNANFHTVNFLDENNNPSSSRTGVVALAIADTGDAGAFWGFHKMAFDNQSTVARDWEFEELADAAEQLGVEEDVVESIRDESVMDEYRPMLDANADGLREIMGDEAGTPALFIDGEYLAVQRDPENPDQLQDWVPQVVGGGSAEDAGDEGAEDADTEGGDTEE